ncbi:hypothetical protein ACFYW6_34010 [Streptomyces sp. NPDC002659]|uniref:hypothetical protein n=1 Tax=Streptomyces sp. NPDC002659 TaxID=3364656 RepID=UPI003689F699
MRQASEVIGSSTTMGVLALPPLRSGGGAQQVGVFASSRDADDDDQAWFGFAGTLDGFDPDTVEEVGGAFGVHGFVEGEQNGEASIGSLVLGGLGDVPAQPGFAGIIFFDLAFDVELNGRRRRRGCRPVRLPCR